MTILRHYIQHIVNEISLIHCSETAVLTGLALYVVSCSFYSHRLLACYIIRFKYDYMQVLASNKLKS